jgi:hypothetical protein
MEDISLIIWGLGGELKNYSITKMYIHVTRRIVIQMRSRESRTAERKKIPVAKIDFGHQLLIRNARCKMKIHF